MQSHDLLASVLSKAYESPGAGDMRGGGMMVQKLPLP
jgi:hypothetical protein